jgi:ABC-type transport system involved in multi-copper enzyme maturation permease subunit
MNILVIARLTFQEAARRKIALTAFLLGLAFLLLYNLAFYFVRQQPFAIPSQALAQREAFNLLLMAGLYAANFMLGVMAVLLSADSLAGEINSGAIHTVVSKPVFRFMIVLGKWFGFAGLLALYVLFLAGGLMLSVGVQANYFPPNPVLGIGLMYLETLLVMSISLAFSSRLSTLATGAAVFGLYGIAFLGGWVEQIGSMLKNQTATEIGITASLLMPTESLWRRAAYEMTSSVLRALGNFNPFGGGASVPSPFMIVYAVLFTLVALAVAVRSFSRRDL